MVQEQVTTFSITSSPKPILIEIRRAKLKRLTSDDRERMMRSRALPDDFDMHQTLHSPFKNPLVPVIPYTFPAGPHFPEATLDPAGRTAISRGIKRSRGLSLDEDIPESRRQAENNFESSQFNLSEEHLAKRHLSNHLLLGQRIPPQQPLFTNELPCTDDRPTPSDIVSELLARWTT